MRITDWCIWKAFQDACPPAVVLLADFLVVLAVWTSFNAFRFLALWFVPEALGPIVEPLHVMATVASYGAVTYLGLFRLLKTYLS
jgi:hypothetical protein